MTYTKQTWTDNLTPVDAAHMNYMESGIAVSDLKVDSDAVVVAATRLVANKLLAGDANPAFQIRGDGRHDWGVGGATATDTSLYRSAAGILKTDGRFQVAGAYGIDVTAGAALQRGLFFDGAAAATTILQSVLVSGDSVGAIRVRGDGRIDWGPGGATPLDTDLYRSAADRLTTDDLFGATLLGLATKAKAGIPVDADWAAAPPIGTIVLDTTNSKLWVRTAAATWKGVVIA